MADIPKVSKITMKTSAGGEVPPPIKCVVFEFENDLSPELQASLSNSFSFRVCLNTNACLSGPNPSNYPQHSAMIHGDFVDDRTIKFTRTNDGTALPRQRNPSIGEAKVLFIESLTNTPDQVTPDPSVFNFVPETSSNPC